MSDLSKKYLESGGSLCPWCGSKDLRTVTPLEHVHDAVYQSVACCACNKHWTDRYALESLSEDQSECADPERRRHDDEPGSGDRHGAEGLEHE